MDEINNLYNEIDKCVDWSVKIELISMLKKKIMEEEDIINNNLSNLDNIVKISKKKINIDTLMDEFNSAKNLEKKIEIYQNLNSFINKLNKTL